MGASAQRALDEEQAELRLRDAAPELLEILREIARGAKYNARVSTDKTERWLWTSYQEKAEAAIRKAEGK